MPRKPGLKSEFVMFDVVYADGTRRSNRKVPRAALSGLQGEAAARTIIMQQDREIAAKSGLTPVAIKTIHRSGAKIRPMREFKRRLAGG